MQTLTIGDIKTYIIPDFNLCSVTVHLRGNAGSNMETHAQIGSAHVIEHCQINGNTHRISIENSGGVVLGVTSREDVLYMTKTLAKNIDDALLFALDIFSGLKERNIGETKRRIEKEIQRYKDIPEKLISRYTYRQTFQDKRAYYLNTGSVSQVRRLTHANITNFYNSQYKKDKFILVVYGNTGFLNTKIC
jgi:predicted Zn-dependent peptidase